MIQLPGTESPIFNFYTTGMSSLSVTLIQSSLYWEDKTANLRHFEAKINSLQDKTEVVLLPEMFSTGFSMHPERLAEHMDGPTVDWMRRLSASYGIILGGSIIIQEEGAFYNRLIWMLPNGQYGYYDKRHLFAYAGENAHYTAGKKRLIASVKGWRVNLQICYDLRFPVWARQQTVAEPAAEYDILVYVANWPETRRKAWMALLQARAIENQCYVIGVNRVGSDGNGINYSGDSMVIDAMGDVLYQGKQEEDVFSIVLERQAVEMVRQRFPFLKDADQFMIRADLS